jgi:hypothetical protein
MDTCTIFYVAFGTFLVSEVILLLNLHRLVRVPKKDLVMQGGKVQRGLNPLQMMRLALGISILVLCGVFVFLLKQEGCIA